jgi:hypothetical protein
MNTVYTVALILVLAATLIVYGTVRLLFSALIIIVLMLVCLWSKYRDHTISA